jgi:hypothetical protein
MVSSNRTRLPSIAGIRSIPLPTVSRLHGGPDAGRSINPLSRDLAPRIVQARRVDGIARAVKSIGVTAFANGADRILRAVRAAVSKDQRFERMRRLRERASSLPDGPQDAA